MFIRVKERPNNKKSVQIVETYRRADKVHQKILRHVGQAETEEEVEVLKNLAWSIIISLKNDRQPVLPLFSPEEIFTSQNKSPVPDDVKLNSLREEQRIIEGVNDIFGKLYSDLGFDQLLGIKKKDAERNSILKTVTIARVANPVSKRRTASLLEEDYGIKIPLEKIYRMMDIASRQEEDIKQKVCGSTFNLFSEKVDVLFFDVTTLYFESVVADELKDFGFSKDCKFKEVQVVLALVSTLSGMPITYELFPGDIYEGHTLIEMIKKLKNKYLIENILLVADRAMFNEKNLKMMEEEQIKYIVAARLKSLPKSLKQGIINDEDFQAGVIENELHWTKEYEYNERRLIVSYNNSRAKKDAADRQRLIDRLMKRCKNGKIKVKELISNYGTKKYLEVENSEAVINENKIEEDTCWDGLHGVISNIQKEESNGGVEEILCRYRGLWQIEEAFRINKHDLKMRPIYHWTPERIKGHIIICFLAFTLVKQAMYRMKCQNMPMSFEQIRNELLHVQASLLVDVKTKKKYILPSHITLNQKRIYQVFGLKRSGVPYVVNT